MACAPTSGVPSLGCCNAVDSWRKVRISGYFAGHTANHHIYGTSGYVTGPTFMPGRLYLQYFQSVNFFNARQNAWSGSEETIIHSPADASVVSDTTVNTGA